MAAWSDPGAASLGIYHWGGRYPASISEGADAIVALGGRVARVTVSPRADLDYHTGGGCHPNFSLTRAVQEPDLQRTLENPGLDVLILTAYDGTTWGDCGRLNFLDPDFFTPERTAAVVREYSDFSLHLYRAFQGTHKRFLISNWESDNSVYCGQAYTFATNPVFRETCRAQYFASYGIRSPGEALRGLKLWFNARAQGIAEGRQRALAEGLGGLRVYHAPEFNIVRALREQGLPSALYDVLPAVMFDYVSYSSWESINMPDPVAALWADLDRIRDAIGSTAIVVGEAGYSRRDFSKGDDVTHLSRFLAAAQAWGVPYVIHWQLYDTDSENTFGLYDLRGQPTLLRDWFQLRFQQLNQLSLPDPSVRPVSRSPLVRE